MVKEQGGSLHITCHQGVFHVHHDNYRIDTYRSSKRITLKEGLLEILEPEKEDDLEWLTS